VPAFSSPIFFAPFAWKVLAENGFHAKPAKRNARRGRKGLAHVFFQVELNDPALGRGAAVCKLELNELK